MRQYKLCIQNDNNNDNNNNNKKEKKLNQKGRRGERASGEGEYDF